ncbi:MAG TPA: hypothetical protein VLX29_03230, partial [Nitrospirota bacterium]|nr:hypothetical protein [Nitrospirota bacterium]
MSASELSTFLTRLANYADEAAASISSAAKLSASTNRTNFTALSAVQAVTALREGDITSEEYASALLERCETLHHLNAFISLDKNFIMAKARD